MHASSSAPNLAAGGGAGGVKRSIIARVPLMGGNRQAEDGYETDHQDYCDVCQQVRCPLEVYFIVHTSFSLGDALLWTLQSTVVSSFIAKIDICEKEMLMLVGGCL